jgi:hypothetical protein
MKKSMLDNNCSDNNGGLLPRGLWRIRHSHVSMLLVTLWHSAADIDNTTLILSSY